MERKFESIVEIVAIANRLSLTAMDLSADADFLKAFGQHRYSDFWGYRESQMREAAAAMAA